MKVFFTGRGSVGYSQSVEERNDIDAVDIITPKFCLTIRTSGIRIVNNVTKEEFVDQNIDLTGEVK